MRSPSGVTADSRGRPVGSRSAAVALLLVGGLVAGCGGGDGGGGVGELVTTAPTAPTAPADGAAPTKAAPESTTAMTPSVTMSGGGTFVLETGGVLASLKLPADRKQEDVAGLRTFLRKAHAPAVRIASVTVTNHSTRAFTLSGFEVHTTAGTVPLYPAATYVNLAMALPGMGDKPDLASAASVVSLTSAVRVPAGQEATTLVGTTAPLGKIEEIVYRQGSATTRLRPLWEVRQAAAKAAREQQRAARQLARQQARAAKRRAGR